MKRLIKKSSEIFKYETTSPIYITTTCFDDPIDYYYLHNENEYYGALLDAMNEYGTDILEYFDERNDLKDIITKMNITVGNDYKAHVQIEATRELSQDEQNIIVDYVRGQFSDGWGEGFEQQDIYQYETEIENEEYDEENEEYYTDYSTETAYVNAHFWNRKNWDITIKKVQ